MEWSGARERALGRLRRHASEGLVDSDIVDLLLIVNSSGEALYTSSSCSGRVVVFMGRDYYDKAGAGVLWLTHDPAECRRSLCGAALEASAAATRDVKAWVSLQPPIVQVHAVNLEVARSVVDCAWRSGFSRAGIWWSRGGWAIVEATARDKMHVALPAPCEALLGLCDGLERLKPRVYSFLECLEAVNRGYG